MPMVQDFFPFTSVLNSVPAFMIQQLLLVVLHPHHQTLDFTLRFSRCAKEPMKVVRKA